MSDMNESLRLYTAENGELKYGDSTRENYIDEDIREDRESRLLFQYKPEGIIRYYFYARSSGRPEQYIAEYEFPKSIGEIIHNNQKKDARKALILRFYKSINDKLDNIGYQLDESQWESQALEQITSPKNLSEPSISDEAQQAIKRSQSFELAAPDMEAALWLFFNKVSPDRSVVISEGGYLEHRGRDDVLIQVDRMRRSVEPIKSSKSEIDDKIIENKKEEFRDAFQEVKKKAHASNDSVSEALKEAGITESLNVDIYDEEKPSRLKREFTKLSFLAVSSALALSIVVIIFLGGSTIQDTFRVVEIGEPVIGTGYEIKSWWVFITTAVVLIYPVVLSLVPTQSDERPYMSINDPAENAVNALSEIRKRSNRREAVQLLENESGRNIKIERDSDQGVFQRKNEAIGVLLGSTLTLMILLGIFSAVSRSGGVQEVLYPISVQVLILFLFLFVLYKSARRILA